MYLYNYLIFGIMFSDKFLFIDSRDRLSGSSSSADFTVELPEAVVGIKKVTLKQVNIPNTIYNVRTGVNDIFRVTRGGTPYIYTIAAGAYTITNLLSTIQTGINALDANTYTLTYSTTTMKVTIAGAGAFIINWSVTASCYYELGFTSSDSASGTSFTGTNVANVALPYNIYLSIPQLGLTTITTFSNDRATFVIPVLENSGSVINYSSEGNFEQVLHFPSPITIHRLDIRLHMRGLTVVNLNGADWTMMLDLN